MKNKIKYITAFAFLNIGVANAQTGVGTTTPDASAVLDVSSTTKGFLMPRLTDTQRNAIVAPAKGLLIFNITSNQLENNTGTPSAPIWTASNAGTPGNNGNSVLNGTSNPIAGAGNDGDFFINTATNTIYGPKTSGAWPSTGTSLVGPTGSTGAQGIQGLSGATGAQGIQGLTGATGNTGATGAQGIQGLTGATGSSGATGAQGIQGPSGTNGTNGTAVLNGTSNPIAANGVNGDFFINTATNTIYGPKISGAWPSTGTSLVGPTGSTGAQGIQGLTGATGAQGIQGLTGATGNTGATGTNGTNGTAVLNGTSNPIAAAGNDGDFFINTTANTIYGPKASGAWPSTGTSLVGPSTIVTASNGLTLTSGDIKLGGTLSNPTTVNQANNNLTFTTGTARTVIDGSFETNGAQYVKTTVVTSAAYTVTQDDNFLVYNNSVNSVFTMPTPASNKGRMIRICNPSDATQIAFPVGTIDPHMTITTTDGGFCNTYICDGFFWFPLAQ
ncbi:beta strand repeat-containing protein [Flavobacterium sp.]|uniref:beta strand repeat-containing protein n=1 Tax=Flavobacterium sp. TaxID=239 RepID=UPI0037514132